MRKYTPLSHRSYGFGVRIPAVAARRLLDPIIMYRLPASAPTPYADTAPVLLVLVLVRE